MLFFGKCSAVEAPVCLCSHTCVTGLATLSSWDSLLLKTEFGHLLTLDDIALPVRWERASTVLKVLKDLLMPLARLSEEMLIRAFTVSMFSGTHHPGKNSLSA